MSDTRILPPFQSQPPTSPYGAPTEPPPPRERGRGRLAAAVVAGALVVGGVAGVGGAAAWDAYQDESSPVTTPSDRQTAQVVDTGDAPAVDGSVEGVAETVLPSVVKIDVVTDQGGGSGSG